MVKYKFYMDRDLESFDSLSNTLTKIQKSVGYPNRHYRQLVPVKELFKAVLGIILYRGTWSPTA